MISLVKDDTLYIYSSGYIECEITGYTIIQGVRTSKVLFDYNVLAGNTRRSYVSFERTVIERVKIIATDPSTIIKVFLNGTVASSTIYEGVVQAGFKEIMDSRGWVDNTFVPADPDAIEIDNNNYFP